MFVLYLVSDLRKVGVYGDNPISSPIKTRILWEKTEIKQKPKQNINKAKQKTKQTNKKQKQYTKIKMMGSLHEQYYGTL